MINSQSDYPDSKLVNREYEQTLETVSAIWNRNSEASYLAAGEWAWDVIYRNHWSAQYTR